MAKRSNPFTEDYVQQRKVHISMKQFNNNEHRLQKVYEKTLELLFEGAKKCQLEDIIGCKENIDSITNKKDKMKQLFIGKNGTLLHSGNMVYSKGSTKACSCSSRGDTQCGYCEVVLCAGCQHVCMHCDRPHCAACSLAGLEGSEVCVSCYS